MSLCLLNTYQAYSNINNTLKISSVVMAKKGCLALRITCDFKHCSYYLTFPLSKKEYNTNVFCYVKIFCVTLNQQQGDILPWQHYCGNSQVSWPPEESVPLKNVVLKVFIS